MDFVWIPRGVPVSLMEMNKKLFVNLIWIPKCILYGSPYGFMHVCYINPVRILLWALFGSDIAPYVIPEWISNVYYVD